MQSLEAHPLADEFPLIEGKEFEELVTSIKEEGLLHDIVLADGKILDGRNRYRACLAAGVEPSFTLFEDPDPARLAHFVIAANLHRRHLTDSQRAVIAGRLVALRQVKISEATQMMKVGERTVRKAAVVVKHGDSNVVSLMQRGEVSVDAAYNQATGRAGRPVGNSKVHKLRRILADLKTLSQSSSEIVQFWPGDPGLNIDLAQCSQFLASLTKATREPDHAPSVA